MAPQDAHELPIVPFQISCTGINDGGQGGHGAAALLRLCELVRRRGDFLYVKDSHRSTGALPVNILLWVTTERGITVR